jgi:hypothetical protein
MEPPHPEKRQSRTSCWLFVLSARSDIERRGSSAAQASAACSHESSESSSPPLLTAPSAAIAAAELLSHHLLLIVQERLETLRARRRAEPRRGAEAGRPPGTGGRHPVRGPRASVGRTTSAWTGSRTRAAATSGRCASTGTTSTATVRSTLARPSLMPTSSTSPAWCAGGGVGLRSPDVSAS